MTLKTVGVRIVSVEFTQPLHADAAAAVGMVHEHKFAPVEVSLFQRGKLPRLGPEGFVNFGSWFLVLGCAVAVVA